MPIPQRDLTQSLSRMLGHDDQKTQDMTNNTVLPIVDKELGEWADALWRPHAAFAAAMGAASCALVWLTLRCNAPPAPAEAGNFGLADTLCGNKTRWRTRWYVALAPAVAGALFGGVLYGLRLRRAAGRRCAAGSAARRAWRAVGAASLLSWLGALASLALGAAALQGSLLGVLEASMGAGSGTASRIARDSGWAVPGFLGAALAALMLVCRGGTGTAGGGATMSPVVGQRTAAVLLLLLATQWALLALKLSASWGRTAPTASAGQSQLFPDDGVCSWRVVLAPSALAALVALLAGAAAAAPCCCCCAAPSTKELAAQVETGSDSSSRRRCLGSGCARRFERRVRRAVVADARTGRPFVHPLPALARKALALRAAGTALCGALGLVTAWGACCRLDGSWATAWGSDVGVGAWAQVPSLRVADAVALGAPALAALLVCGGAAAQMRWARLSRAAMGAHAHGGAYENGSRGNTDILELAARNGGYLNTSLSTPSAASARQLAAEEEGSALPEAVDRSAWVADTAVTGCQLCFRCARERGRRRERWGCGGRVTVCVSHPLAAFCFWCFLCLLLLFWCFLRCLCFCLLQRIHSGSPAASLSPLRQVYLRQLLAHAHVLAWLRRTPARVQGLRHRSAAAAPRRKCRSRWAWRASRCGSRRAPELARRGAGGR